MPPGPNGNVNETLSLRKRFGAMWMPWIREYFACLAGLPLFPVGSPWFVFVLRFFKSSHNLILYIVHLGCAPVSLSWPSDSIVWPVWLFSGQLGQGLSYAYFSHLGRLQDIVIPKANVCSSWMGIHYDTLLVCNGSEVQPKQEVVPTPAHDLGQWTLKWNAFTTALQTFQNLRRHPWSSRGCLHF